MITMRLVLPVFAQGAELASIITYMYATTICITRCQLVDSLFYLRERYLYWLSGENPFERCGRLYPFNDSHYASVY